MFHDTSGRHCDSDAISWTIGQVQEYLLKRVYGIKTPWGHALFKTKHVVLRGLFASQVRLFAFGLAYSSSAWQIVLAVGLKQTANVESQHR